MYGTTPRELETGALHGKIYAYLPYIMELWDDKVCGALM